VNSSPQSPQGYRFGIFEIDLEARELRKNGLKVRLQEQPFKILVAMVRQPGKVISRDELYAELSSHKTYDFKHGLNNAIQKIREVLGDSAENARFIETVAGRGYRFLPQVEVINKPSVPDDNQEPSVNDHQPGTRPDLPIIEPNAGLADRPLPEPRSRRTWIAVAGGVATVALLAVLFAGGYFNRGASASKLTDKDTVVLAEFTNTTDDPVFDLTLRQGLSGQLEQSPFLNLLSDHRSAEILVLMSQAKDARLTPELARQVCQRSTSSATIEGSITKLGTQYVLGVEAVNCMNGDVLAREQVTADSKEQVLNALGLASTKMRAKLGESLASVQKYDVPLESVTTLSLEALRAFSLGYQAQIREGDVPAAIPLYERAIGLDSNFAMAYGRLGTSYNNLGESVRAVENIRKGYELRQRVSEREKFYLASHYEDTVTGNLEAARRTYELWIQTYPRDENPRGNLAFIYSQLGEYERALTAYQFQQQLTPSDGLRLASLAGAYLSLNRIAEGKAVLQEGQSRHLDSPSFHLDLYWAAFMEHDAVAMERESAWLMGKSGYEIASLYAQSNTAAYAGQFARAREITRREVSFARHSGEKEPAAICQSASAVHEALAGNMSLAKQQAKTALTLSNAKYVEAMAAVALGLADDVSHASRLATDLAERFPEDTVVQSVYLPTVYAVIALQKSHWNRGTAEAIDALAAAVPYELGESYLALYPAYVRGEAYLAANQGRAAIIEFEKIASHPGVVLNDIIGALTYLQLGRAYVLAGDTERAKIAYQDFLTLWKDADKDIPILKQARAENAKLHAPNEPSPH
jgi:DNA-binding winged helix-turn-helix (wHTH) protein/tetratricopeptide (TPR) repeat protein